MPETTYIPDPRAQPLIFPPSREFGSFNLTGDSASDSGGGAGLAEEGGSAVDFWDSYSVGATTSFDGGEGFDTAGVGTGTSIIAATMASGLAHQRLSITAGQFGRRMPWGNDWGRIQIAVLWRIAHTATFTSQLAYLGVCSGTTNMAASATTSNFCGVITPADASACAFSAGTRVNLFTINPAYRFVSRRVTTNTDRTSGAGSAGACISASAGYLSSHFLEISRPTFASPASSISYSFGRKMSDTSRVEDSLEQSALWDLLHSDVTSTLGGGNTVGIIVGGVSNTVSYSFDESAGELDTINITWPESFALEIGAIGVRKVY